MPFLGFFHSQPESCMKAIIVSLLLLAALTTNTNGQAMGNIITAGGNNNYGNQSIGQKGNARWNEEFYRVSGSKVTSSVRILYRSEIKKYEVVYGVAEESETIEKCKEKIGARIGKAVAQVKRLGIDGDEIYVDMVAQPRIYAYQESESDPNLIVEKQVGFEMKKNVIIRFKKHDDLEKINDIMAENGIFDLIKVDLITETRNEAMLKVQKDLEKIIQEKRELILQLLHPEMSSATKVTSLNLQGRYPSENYGQYTAAESNRVTAVNRHVKNNSKMRIDARDVITYFYQGEKEGDYDLVIHRNQNASIPTVDFVITAGFEFGFLE